MIRLKVTGLLKHHLILGSLVVLVCLLAGTRANAQADDLINAATNGDLHRVKALVGKGSDVNAKASDGWTALMYACQNGHLDVVQVLLAKRADVNVRSNSGITALMLAAQMGQNKIVRALIDAKSDLSAKDNSGKTALMYASAMGHDDISQLLKSAAILASRRANAELGEDLISEASQGNLPRVMALLSNGVDANYSPLAGLVAGGGATALVYASQNGHLEVVQALLANGADVNADGGAALILASQNGHPDVVKALRDALENQQSATGPMVERRNQDVGTLPSVQEIGWIDSQQLVIATASGTGGSRTVTSSGRTRYDILRCSDGHDYVLLFVDPKMAGVSFTPGRSNIYKITGKVSVIPPKFWPEDTNPFRTMTNSATGMDENRDVSHMILVQSIQSLNRQTP